MGGLGVAGDTRHGLVREGVPEDFPVGAVEGEEAPLVFLAIRGGGDVALEPDLEVGLAVSRDGRRDENLLTPDDG